MPDDILGVPDDAASALLRTGFHASVDGDGVAVRLRGELDMATAPRLGAVLDEALDAMPHQVRLDLSELTFLDSTGIRVLVTACHRAKDQNCRFTLQSPRDAVLRTLKLTGVDRLMVIDSRTPRS